MKPEALKKRLDRNRPMTTITIRMPEDVIEDLKQVAPSAWFFWVSTFSACLYRARVAS
jgi:hypothetical protein